MNKKETRGGTRKNAGAKTLQIFNQIKPIIMTKLEKAKDLAEKLARHAESAAKIGNKEEAMAFAAKVAEITDKWGFSVEIKDESDFVEVHFEKAKYYEKVYLDAISKLYGVSCFVRDYKIGTKKGAYVSLYGRPNSIDCVNTLYDAMDDILKVAHRKALSEFMDSISFTMSRTDGYNFKRDFYRGVGEGIKAKVEKARRSYAVGLMEVLANDRAQALEDFKAKNKTTTYTIKQPKNSHAFKAGFAAGLEAKSTDSALE